VVLDFLKDRIYETGVAEYGFLNPSEIEFRQVIRNICADNTCGRYGTTWACPPGVGTVEECRQRCLQYDTMLVFSCLTFLNDPFDLEEMKKGMEEFKSTSRNLESTLKPYLGRHLTLSSEGCNTCKGCTYPDAPCRFPESLHHSPESYGILVNELAEKSGLAYDNGTGTITYFGAVLFSRVDLCNSLSADI